MHFDLENFAPYMLSTLSRKFSVLLEKSLRSEGLSLSNWRVLLCLSTYEQRTLNQIVDYTLLPQSTLSRSLVRMEERGLISKTRRSDDARNYKIKITQQGRNKLENTMQTVQIACEEPLKILTADEKKVWMKIMKKIIANVQYL